MLTGTSGSGRSAVHTFAVTETAIPFLTALRRARDLIDRSYAEPLDLDAMAREAGYSRFHFARGFTTSYGETPRAYLTRRRIERAKTLLRTANLSVTEICLLVGFSSVGSFSARFHELVGQSPSAYRDASVARSGVPPIPGCVVLMWTRPHPEGPQAGRSADNAVPGSVGGESNAEEAR
jgi:AraC-like DNA-binding protein